MKDGIELIEYFTEKGWTLNEKQIKLMWDSYLLGKHDANYTEGEKDEK